MWGVGISSIMCVAPSTPTGGPLSNGSDKKKRDIERQLTQSKSRLEKAQDEGYAIVPACLVNVSAKDKFARSILWACTCQAGDADDDDAGNAPHEGGTVDRVQEPCAKDVDEPRADGKDDVDEELVPGLLLVRGVEQGYDADDERARQGRRRGRQADPTGAGEPSGKVGGRHAGPGRGKTSHEMVRTTRGGNHGTWGEDIEENESARSGHSAFDLALTDFSQAQGDAKDADC